MCSIRSGSVVAMMFVALAMMSAAAGCQGVSKHQPLSPVNNTPLVVDEAMQIRDWDRSTNYYANGATIAGGTAYCWETADWVNEDHRRFVDAPVAVLNFVSMPVGLFVNSPFEKQVIHGEIVPPSYTGQPPLPGEPPPNRPTPEATEMTVPVAEPATPPPPPDAPPAVEMPAAPPTPSDTPQPLPPPVTPEPPPAPPAPPAPTTPSDPITPEPGTTPPAAVEPAPPDAPVPPAPPAPTADPLNK